jgi:hypothetical protein
MVRVWRSGGVLSRGMQVEIRCRTQEAPSVPDRSGWMTATELGHVKDMDPGYGVGSVVLYSSGRDQVGWFAIYTQTGCLIRHSTQRWGKPTTRGRT